MVSRALSVCEGAFATIAALLVSCQACAGNEYVNATFCYRIVQPEAVSHVTVNHDGSGIAMDVGHPCEPHACARLSISASYTWGADKASDAYRDALKQGWVLKATEEKRMPGAVWVEHLMNRGDGWLDLYETSRREDQARYALRVQFATAQSVAARRAALEVLDSWRWLSTCR
ncbi:hypothetical protein [Dyella sp. C11]|uniref:hypothetical protein n=1 Tax=Dyella sp. C11 TaxID=2126991 RepID=UPI000D646F74|nr:hypothetical protein [Dyella sp. C11]